MAGRRRFVRRRDVPLDWTGEHADDRVARASIGSRIMPETFAVTQSRVASADPALHDEILRRTGSDAQTLGILRSIERFGDDPSILRYEVTPKTSNRFGGPARTVVWTVRGVRS